MSLLFWHFYHFLLVEDICDYLALHLKFVRNRLMSSCRIFWEAMMTTLVSSEMTRLLLTELLSSIYVVVYAGGECGFQGVVPPFMFLWGVRSFGLN